MFYILLSSLNKHIHNQTIKIKFRYLLTKNNIIYLCFSFLFFSMNDVLVLIADSTLSIIKHCCLIAQLFPPFSFCFHFFLFAWYAYALIIINKNEDFLVLNIDFIIPDNYTMSKNGNSNVGNNTNNNTKKVKFNLNKSVQVTKVFARENRRITKNDTIFTMIDTDHRIPKKDTISTMVDTDHPGIVN